MSELDVVQIPGYPGKWARRCVVEAWIAAGRPYVNWAGRTYEQQKYMYNLWRQGRGNAADNPDANTRQPHVRGMALDLAGYNKGRMEAAGFVQPIWRRTGFSQDEPWHWELRRYVGSIKNIPKVTGAQVASLDSKPFEEDDMYTDEDRNRDNATYAAMFGARNLTGKPDEIKWLNIGGDSQAARYGVLPITIHNQTLIAQQAGRLAAIEQVVEQLATANGAVLDMTAIEQAAARGAREALDGLTFTANAPE